MKISTLIQPEKIKNQIVQDNSVEICIVTYRCGIGLHKFTIISLVLQSRLNTLCVKNRKVAEAAEFFLPALSENPQSFTLSPPFSTFCFRFQPRPRWLFVSKVLISEFFYLSNIVRFCTTSSHFQPKNWKLIAWYISWIKFDATTSRKPFCHIQDVRNSFRQKIRPWILDYWVLYCLFFAVIYFLAAVLAVVSASSFQSITGLNSAGKQQQATLFGTFNVLLECEIGKYYRGFLLPLKTQFEEKFEVNA